MIQFSVNPPVEPKVLYMNIEYIPMLYMYGMSIHTDIQDTKAGRWRSRRETCYEKQSEKGQRELKGEDKELSSAIWLWAFTDGNV